MNGKPVRDKLYPDATIISMYDDDPWGDLVDPDDFDEAESTRSLSGRGCLFLAITVILIASLVGSSILTYFAITRSQSRVNDDQLGARQSIVAPGPTAAPATVIAAAAALPTSEPPAPELIPEINRIAIVNGEGQVETMSPSGENRRILTLSSDNALFQFPAWTPDGRHLAVIGSRMNGSGIYVLEDTARTGSLLEHQVYFSADEPPIYLFWSPDNVTLGFLANHARDTLGLNVIAGDGTSESRLLATGAPFYWDWTDDGRQLLIHAGQTRADDTLALIDLNGDPQAGNLANPGEFQAPGVGPGGRYWAFAEATDDGFSSLVVIDTQTGERMALGKVGSLALGWSPAGDQIAYTNGAANEHPFWGPLHLLDMTTGDDRQLTTQTVLAFFWSPDGRQIAFVTLNNLEFDDSINAALPDKSRHMSRVAEVPAAQPRQGFLTLSVVNVETGQGLRLLDFEPTRVYLSQFLPFFDQYALSHSIWSPDSRSIVLPVREDGRNSILIIPAEGGRPNRLAEGDIGFWSHK